MKRLAAISAAALAVAATPGLTIAAEAEAPAVNPADARSGAYKTDPTHAYITFSYLHQGYSRPMLRWRTWSGDLNWNAEDPDASSVNASIETASIDSGVDVFDGHLRGEKWFDVEKFPEITFKSTSLEATGETAGTMTGDLTIKGITKPVTFDVALNRAANDDFAKAHKLGFSAVGSVKRSEFDLGDFVPFVGDDVEIKIEAEFVSPRDE